MKNLELFSKFLSKLKTADFTMSFNDKIYQRGVLVYHDLTFEYACNAIQEILPLHGAEEAHTGSPREVLQLAYKFGFVDDEAVWLTMLKKRNTSVHIYNEDEIDEMLLLIRDSFIPAFGILEDTLRKKLSEVDEEWTQE